MKQLRNAMGAAIVAAGLVGSLTLQANAVVMMQTFDATDFPGDSDAFTGTGTGEIDLIFDFSLQQFDPSLGTLLGVDVTFSAFAGFDDTLSNDGTTDITYDGGDSSLGSISAPGISNAQAIGGSFGGAPLAAGASISGQLPDPTGQIPVGTFAVDPADFGPYIGLGNFAAQMLGSSSFSVDAIDPAGTPNINWSGFAEAEGTVTVTYTFDDAPVANTIPEPISATLGLMGLGVLSLTTRRRVA